MDQGGAALKGYRLQVTGRRSQVPILCHLVTLSPCHPSGRRSQVASRKLLVGRWSQDHASRITFYVLPELISRGGGIPLCTSSICAPTTKRPSSRRRPCWSRASKSTGRRHGRICRTRW